MDGEAEAIGLSASLWPIFGVVWDAGRVLASIMSDEEIEGLRFLEVGCGIGLASLLLNRREADITAVDRNPAAARFLAVNTALNDGPAIPFARSDWREHLEDLGRFDVIIGSDLLYERIEGQPLADFMLRHAKPSCRVVLVDAGRGMANRFARHLVDHGFAHEMKRAVDMDAAKDLEIGVRMQVHLFQR